MECVGVRDPVTHITQDVTQGLHPNGGALPEPTEEEDLGDLSSEELLALVVYLEGPRLQQGPHNCLQTNHRQIAREMKCAGGRNIACGHATHLKAVE